MNDWPEGWYRDDRPRRPARDGADDARTARYPDGRRGGGYYPDDRRSGYYPDDRRSGYYRDNRHGGYYPDDRGGGGYWPQQPPPRTAPPRRGAPQGPPQGPPRGPVPPGRGLGKRVAKIVAVVVVLIIVAGVCFYFYLNSRLDRIPALASFSGQPAAGAGQNWLLTGSDSRQGITKQQENQLSLGHNIGGSRTDTIMLLHLPSNGTRPVLVSLPRDSFVPIPGHGENKLNAAYSYGGPKLLAQTVENATGLYINHYMGIGLGGLVGVVNDVGGVNMCIPHALNDTASGLHLKAGCQTLNGGQALSFVRDRHSFGSGDLQREQDQRLLLKGLLNKVTSTGTLINPFATIPAAQGAVSALQVDQGTQLYQLAKVAFALRNPITTMVPIASANDVTVAGTSILWDRSRASQLFNDLDHDTQPPASLTGGATVGG